MKQPDNFKGFSLVELMVVIAIIAILSVSAFVGIQATKDRRLNSKVRADLLAITLALEQFKQDNGGYPVPKTPEEGNPNPSMNLLCFNADATYAHDCQQSEFRQGMIGNNLMTKRYLTEVPTDPRTGSRYVYGVSNDGEFYQVAGVVREENSTWRALVVGNVQRGFGFPSLIRAYDAPHFVFEEGRDLPYSPNHSLISASLVNINGQVQVNGQPPISPTVNVGDVITTGADGNAEIYFSDGSVSKLDPDSELQILGTSEVEENDEDSIITKIRLKLLSGKLWNKVARLAENSEFSIETNSAIAGVRGTEFGVFADENKVIVNSGTVWVAENLPSNLVSAVGGNPHQAYMSNTGPTAETAVTDSYLLDYIDEHHEAPNLSEVVIPYIVEVVAIPSAPYDVYVSFNGGETEDDYEIDGFELYGGSQVRSSYVLEDADFGIPLQIVTGVDYNPAKKAYHFTVDYSPSSPLWDDTVVLRAFKQSGGLTQFSSLSGFRIRFLMNPTEIVETEYENYPQSDEEDDWGECGDGVLDLGEKCEWNGNLFGGASCESQTGGMYGGTLDCTTDCKIDISGCTSGAIPSCGDGIIGIGEDCEPSLPITDTCATVMGGGATGTLTCNMTFPNACTYDTSGCSTSTCGNFALDSGEQCDFDASSNALLGGATCASEVPGSTGTLGCVASSCTFNTTGCSSAPPPAVCGNNTAETGEACDGTDLNGATCTTVGVSSPYTGSPACDSSCNLTVGTCATAPPSLASLCVGTGKWYDSLNDKCWVLGGDSQSCTNACNAVDSSVQCAGGTWNDDVDTDLSGLACDICEELTGIVVDLGFECIADIADYSPFINNIVPACRYRSGAPASNFCDLPSASGEKRICKCE